MFFFLSEKQGATTKKIRERNIKKKREREGEPLFDSDLGDEIKRDV